MVVQQWGSRLQRLLLAYFQIEWVQTANLVLYFIVQILLAVFLTLLPIKITYNWLLTDISHLNIIVQIIVLVIFASHIYLYLNYKLGKLVRNPEIQKKLLFQNKVVKMKWLNLVTIELVYDVLCLCIAIYEVVQNRNILAARLLELFYLAKIYKIKMFHDRFQNYIIGTSFYVIYNVFYGMFILIILVSYVGCIFYQIDYALYQSNYEYPNLLWVNQSAWNDIINSGFGVQLLYAIYWSVGTASSCAYGDISASAPPDVVYNILCLYFQGFLFGFYLSRIHSLPATMSEKENELLELFQKFENHNNDIKAQGEVISHELYFRILCSIEYQQARKKSLEEIESILPEDYIIEIKGHIFNDFISMNPMNLWPEQELKNALCLKIKEVVTEVGEQLFQYADIDQGDLVYLKTGKLDFYCQIDHSQQFVCHLEDGSLLNTFGFITGLRLDCLAAELKSYSIFYVLKRNDFKGLLSPQKITYFNSLSAQMISFENEEVGEEPIGLYANELASKKSDVLLMNPERTREYIINILNRAGESNSQRRRWMGRKEGHAGRTVGLGRKRMVDVGVQCSEQFTTQLDKVMILGQ